MALFLPSVDTLLLKKPDFDPSVSAHFRFIPNFLEGFFSNVCNQKSLSHRIYILYSQLVANIIPLNLSHAIYRAADNGLATLLLSLDLSAAFHIIDTSFL